MPAVGHNLASVVSILGLLALLPIPGAFLGLSGRAPRTLLTWINATAFGYATSILALYVTSLRDYRLFVPVWVTATALASFLWWRRGRSPKKAFEASEHDRYITKRFWMLIGAVFALRIAPTLFREFPLGWDPYFHLVAAAKIASVHSLIVDLKPIEALPLNYPLGSHVLLALLSDLGGVPVHRVFGIAIASFGTLCSVQLFALAYHFTKDLELSLYATAAYGLLAVLGSLGYYDWGGLPNLIAVYFFLGILSLVATASDSGSRNVLRYAFLFLAIGVVHHHAMVVVPAVLIPLAAYQTAFSKDNHASRLILWGNALSIALGLGYFLTYLRRVVTVRETAILGFDEGFSSVFQDLHDLGIVFSLLVIVGVVCAIYLPRSRRFPATLVVPATALIVYYAGLKYGVRAIIQMATGHQVSLFTPSRFLTDAVPLLAIFAGMCVVEVRRRLGTSNDRVLVAIAVCALLNLPFYSRLFRDEITAPYQAAYLWLRNNSGPSAGILERPIHGTYLTGRIASEMPMPVSEYSAKAGNRVRLHAFMEGRVSAADFGELYAIEQNAEFRALPGPVVWNDASGLHIRRLH